MLLSREALINPKRGGDQIRKVMNYRFDSIVRKGSSGLEEKDERWSNGAWFFCR
jgi:hypothetical protein